MSMSLRERIVARAAWLSSLPENVIIQLKQASLFGVMQPPRVKHTRPREDDPNTSSNTSHTPHKKMALASDVLAAGPEQH